MMALSTISGPQTRSAPYSRASNRVVTVSPHPDIEHFVLLDFALEEKPTGADPDHGSKEHAPSIVQLPLQISATHLDFLPVLFDLIRIDGWRRRDAESGSLGRSGSGMGG